MSRRRSREAERLPPLLVRLIEAAEHHGKDAQGGDITGAASALREFGTLALWALPIHGVFVPNSNDVSRIIERVARRHLAVAAARRELREALSSVEPFAHRDSIESALNRAEAASAEAYFYAGLAFGVTLAEYT